MYVASFIITQLTKNTIVFIVRSRWVLLNLVLPVEVQGIHKQCNITRKGKPYTKLKIVMRVLESPL